MPHICRQSFLWQFQLLRFWMRSRLSWWPRCMWRTIFFSSMTGSISYLHITHVYDQIFEGKSDYCRFRSIKAHPGRATGSYACFSQHTPGPSRWPKTKKWYVPQGMELECVSYGQYQNTNYFIALVKEYVILDVQLAPLDGLQCFQIY